MSDDETAPRMEGGEEELEMGTGRVRRLANLSKQEKAERVRRNDKAMAQALRQFARVPKEDWLDTLVVTSSARSVVNNVEDDHERELVFTKQALECAIEACNRLKEKDVRYRRPDDYFAEMAKSDEHMLRLQERLARKKERVEAAEDAARTRELRKFGKEVQQVKVAEREEEKKRTTSAVKKWRKEHAQGDDFDLEKEEGGVPRRARDGDDDGDDADGAAPSAKRAKRDGERGGKRPVGARKAEKDAKYKYQGRKKAGWRRNDAESHWENDKALNNSLPGRFDRGDADEGAKRRGFGGKRGGRGGRGGFSRDGDKPNRPRIGQRPKKSTGSRPGKSRRQANRR